MPVIHLVFPVRQTPGEYRTIRSPFSHLHANGGAVAQSGGLTVVQDPNDVYLPYMAFNAIQANHVMGIYPLDELAAVLATLASGGAVARTGREASEGVISSDPT
jgi:ABC-type Fe3+ transport system permease subunit